MILLVHVIVVSSKNLIFVHVNNYNKFVSAVLNVITTFVPLTAEGLASEGPH